MRNIVLATVLLSTNAVADIGALSKLTDEQIGFCSDMQEMAMEVMSERQSGKPFMDAIKEAKKEDPEGWQEIRMQMVVAVYDTPVRTGSWKEEAVNEFGNDIGSGCLERTVKDYEEKAEFERALLEEERREEEAPKQTQHQRYIMLIAQRVENNWLRPATTSEEQSCEVIVTQTMMGDVIDVQLQSCTSDKAFQRSVERAVRKASPLPLPPDPELFDREIYFKFKPR